ncbi:unnamed protein product [Calicophoron daubneyi]|uniref:Neurotransmitter-gated ion-channel transmembrane domain-containing protein n=1 Tax=Calicophoron daubneyi TaxID=300641 RepID=A0AAV2TXD6_CALDB
MNIFVAFSLLLKILATSTPSASTYVPYLGYYYCFNMTLLSLSTFLSTMVINLHAFGTKGYCVPEWLTELVSAMALPLGITKPQGLDVAEDTLSVIEARLREKKYRYMFSPPGNQERHYCHPKSTQGVLDCLRLEPNTASIQVGNGNPPPFQDNPCQSFEQMKCNHKYLEKVSPGTAHCPASRYPPNIVLRWSQDSTPQAGDDLPPYSNKKAMKQEKKKLVDQLRRHSSGNRKTLGVQTSMRALKEALKNLMTKIDKKEKAARRERDWHLVAMTMDRICFWFYVLMIIGAGFYLLFPRGPIHTVEETIEMHKEFYERRNAEIATQCLLRHDVRIQIGS